MWLRQSTAATVRLGPFVDETDAKTFESALTIQKADVKLSKNGGAFGAASADQGASNVGASYDANGEYAISLDTTDTGTLGRLKVSIYKSGALPVWAEFMVLPAVVYDALVAGTGALSVVLASTERVKLHATQPDYAPAKAGDAMALTPTERTAVANEVEAQIIDDTDSERVLQAIVDKIAEANPSLEDLTLGAIAAAVRDEVERVGGTLALNRIDLATLLLRATELRLAQLDAENVPASASGANAKAADLQSRTPAALSGGRMPAVLAADPPTLTQIRGAITEDHGEGAYGPGDVAGAYTVTITAVDDDTDELLPEVQITVRTTGGVLKGQKRTNDDGEYALPLNDGDYLVSASGIPGYSGVADEPLTVDGANASLELRLAPIASATVNPGTRLVRVVTVDPSGAPLAGVRVRAHLANHGRSSVDQALIVDQTLTGITDEAGVADLVLITEDQFEEGGGVYVIGWGNYEARTTIPAGSGVLNLQEYLASP